MGSKKKRFYQHPPTTAHKKNGSEPLAVLPKKKDPPPEHPLNTVLETYLADVRSILRTHQIVMPHVLSWLKSQHEKNGQTFEKFKTEVDEDGKTFYKTDSAHQAAELLAAIREMENLRGVHIPNTLQRSLFTQLFSEFDSFIGGLLKVIYTKKADLLKSIAREITFSDLLQYDDLNAIKLDMLEKEIDSIRRESYVEQFAILETKFSLKTLKAFPEWGEFVELSQRRNILVHNGGRVSDQYLMMCDRAGYEFKQRPKIGDVLLPSVPYFSRAVVVMSKVAFMLTHTLWRKLFPDEVELAHESANTTLYNLLRDKRWRTGVEIARFCVGEQMSRDISDVNWRIRIVNAAIAAKFSENKEEAKKYLDSVDWSASYRDFRLARAVLMDDFVEAANVMKSIGRSGEIIQELDYHEWPLFHKFRDSAEFLNAYQEIYQTSFVREAVRQSKETASEAAKEAQQQSEVHDVPAKEVGNL